MTLLERFWSKVDASGECWLWTGHVQSAGYGDMAVRKGVRVLAHRLSWQLAHAQPVPDGVLICHHCDVRPCVRPDHLFAGSHSDNLRDAIRKGRKPCQLITIGGETLPAGVWARRFGVSRELAYLRMRKGIDPMIAVAAPAGSLGRAA